MMAKPTSIKRLQQVALGSGLHGCHGAIQRFHGRHHDHREGGVARP